MTEDQQDAFTKAVQSLYNKKFTINYKSFSPETTFDWKCISFTLRDLFQELRNNNSDLKLALKGSQVSQLLENENISPNAFPFTGSDIDIAIGSKNSEELYKSVARVLNEKIQPPLQNQNKPNNISPKKIDDVNNYITKSKVCLIKKIGTDKYVIKLREGKPTAPGFSIDITLCNHKQMAAWDEARNTNIAYIDNDNAQEFKIEFKQRFHKEIINTLKELKVGFFNPDMEGGFLRILKFIDKEADALFIQPGIALAYLKNDLLTLSEEQRPIYIQELTKHIVSLKTNPNNIKGNIIAILIQHHLNKKQENPDQCQPNTDYILDKIKKTKNDPEKCIRDFLLNDTKASEEILGTIQFCCTAKEEMLETGNYNNKTISGEIKALAAFLNDHRIVTPQSLKNRLIFNQAFHEENKTILSKILGEWLNQAEDDTDSIQLKKWLSGDFAARYAFVLKQAEHLEDGENKTEKIDEAINFLKSNSTQLTETSFLNLTKELETFSLNEQQLYNLATIQPRIIKKKNSDQTNSTQNQSALTLPILKTIIELSQIILNLVGACTPKTTCKKITELMGAFFRTTNNIETSEWSNRLWPFSQISTETSSIKTVKLQNPSNQYKETITAYMPSAQEISVVLAIGKTTIKAHIQTNTIKIIYKTKRVILWPHLDVFVEHIHNHQQYTFKPISKSNNHLLQSVFGEWISKITPNDLNYSELVINKGAPIDTQQFLTKKQEKNPIDFIEKTIKTGQTTLRNSQGNNIFSFIGRGYITTARVDDKKTTWHHCTEFPKTGDTTTPFLSIKIDKKRTGKQILYDITIAAKTQNHILNFSCNTDLREIQARAWLQFYHSITASEKVMASLKTMQTPPSLFTSETITLEQNLTFLINHKLEGGQSFTGWVDENGHAYGAMRFSICVPNTPYDTVLISLLGNFRWNQNMHKQNILINPKLFMSCLTPLLPVGEICIVREPYHGNDTHGFFRVTFVNGIAEKVNLFGNPEISTTMFWPEIIHDTNEAFVFVPDNTGYVKENESKTYFVQNDLVFR